MNSMIMMMSDVTLVCSTESKYSEMAKLEMGSRCLILRTAIPDTSLMFDICTNNSEVFG